MIKRSLGAAALLAAGLWTTGCTADLPGGGEVTLDPDGVSVGNGDGSVSTDQDGNTSVTGEGENTLNIATADGTVTEDCQGRSVNITANAGEVVLNGDCAAVTVLGSNMTVHIGTVETITVMGADNTVYYSGGEPATNNLGTGNDVSQGGNAQS
ncbi:DUF3060 domain-containing protein [Nocardiopsis sp. CNT312]|uniref:DUF3060 domain-containing protein n=1 Tax=Nocardiopsis sp. CNT312 TaxID=1137268 RepID=UPI0004B99C75|nr:DUF3060 domain-containing protein [Nocardiopsis sp. CNT312]